MPRLFTGIEIPQDIAIRLMMLRGNIPDARWIDADNYHITLRFLGDVSELIADEYIAAIEQPDFEPFELTFKGVGYFGTKRPSAVWAGLEPSKPLTDLHKAHEKAAMSIGLEPEPRKFTPHVTLARIRRKRSFEVAGFMADYAKFKLEPFLVTGFALYSAKPSTGGGPYVVEQRFEFGNTS